MNDLARLNRVETAGKLSASIAHEIRQPLAAIASSGSAGLNWLNNKVPDLDEARAALQAVITQSHRADDVIKSIGAMFRSEPVARVAVDLNDLVQQVLLLVERPMRSNSIVLKTTLEDRTSPLVMADPVQLQQVILNLIMNAIEAMSTSYRRTRVLHIETRFDQAGNVLLLVQDSGPGFDDKVAENMFKAFVTTKSNGGNGSFDLQVHCRAAPGHPDGGLDQGARGDVSGCIAARRHEHRVAETKVTSARRTWLHTAKCRLLDQRMVEVSEPDQMTGWPALSIGARASSCAPMSGVFGLAAIPMLTTARTATSETHTILR